MRILAFGDLHGDNVAMRELQRKSKDADIIMCCGDLTVFQQNMDKILAKLNSFGKPMLIIHGNHERERDLKEAMKDYPNLIWLHKKALIVEGVLFVGYGGGGFDDQTPEMYQYFRDHNDVIRSAAQRIFMFHAPPHNTKTDLIGRMHNGSKTEKALILKYQPQLTICGHFHDTWGVKEMVSAKSLLINPGPYGELILL